ncbi:MAG: hypothetical protein GY953_33795 [bacterium]|nr:hypothetical protein [bacterium]
MVQVNFPEASPCNPDGSFRVPRKVAERAPPEPEPSVGALVTATESYPLMRPGQGAVYLSGSYEAWRTRTDADGFFSTAGLVAPQRKPDLTRDFISSVGYQAWAFADGYQPSSAAGAFSPMANVPKAPLEIRLYGPKSDMGPVWESGPLFRGEAISMSESEQRVDIYLLQASVQEVKPGGAAFATPQGLTDTSAGIPRITGYKFSRPLDGHMRIMGRYSVDGAGIVNIIQP